MAAAIRALAPGRAGPAVGSRERHAGQTGQARSGQRPAGLAGWHLTLHCQGGTRMSVMTMAGNTVQVAVTGQRHTLRLLKREGARLRSEHAGVQRMLPHHDDGQRLQLLWQAATFCFTEPKSWAGSEPAADAPRVLAPMAGTAAQLTVQPGDEVAEDQPLVCTEAMKMELWQHANAAGTVAAVHVAARDSVAAGALLIDLKRTQATPKDPAPYCTPKDTA